MKAKIAACASGALFALGLGVSGMTHPSKVLGFLDLAGPWDASLAFVMVGAVAVYALASRLALRRQAPFLETKFYVPTQRALDWPLMVGSALFGVGWGIAGFCPGPALVTMASGSLDALLFVIAMAAGMALQARVARTPPRRTTDLHKTKYLA